MKTQVIDTFLKFSVCGNWIQMPSWVSRWDLRGSESYHKETVLFIPKWLTFCFPWFFHAGRFAFNLIHPNGTGFHNVLNSSPGWINHPCFSPDSKSLLFTWDYVGLSVNWSQCHISSSHTVTLLSPRLMALDWLDSLIVPRRMGHLGGDAFQ
jgi:hypothetical protein